MLQEALSRFSSIDELLGESRTRFFGAGFRLVQHDITDVEVSPRERTTAAKARIDYPASWSTKKSRELQPHLSTLDAFIIGAQLCETHLRTAYGIDGDAIDRVWVSRTTLKPSNTPTLDLTSVPASCTLVRTEAISDSLCGHLSSFTAQVGSIALEFVLDHPIGTPSESPARWSNLGELLGPAESRYYGSAYTLTQLVLRDIEFDVSGERVRSLLDLYDPLDMPRLRGMSSAYFPFLSLTNIIVGLAQLAQSLMYRYDNIQRDASHNLWMRRVALHSAEPVAVRRGLRAETWSTKMSLLPLKDAM